MKKITLLILAMLAMNVSLGQFLEDFNGATFPPAGWTVYPGTNGLGTVEAWVSNGTAPDLFAFNRWEAVAPATASAEDWLVSPLIPVNATQNELTFDAGDFNAGSFGSVLSIRVSTTSQTNIASFVEVDNLTEAELGNNAGLVFTNFSVDLSTYLGQSVYIAFVHIQNDGDAVAVDNVVVSAPPACDIAQGLALTAFTSTTATVGWTNIGDFEIEYGVFPRTQGNLTSITATVTAANSYQLTGLMPGVAYNVFVRQNCGLDGFSAYETIIAGTSPSPMVTFPFAEDLEPDANQALLLNLGLSFFTNTNNWSFGQDDLTDGNTANDFASNGISYIFSNNTFAATDADATIYFGPYNLTVGSTYTLSVDQRNTSAASATTPNKDIELLAAATNDGTSNTVLATFDDMINVTHQLRTGNFTPAASGSFYFGVRDKSNVLAGVAAGNSVVIDNIRLTSTLSVTDIDNVKLTHFYNLANQTFNVESSNGSINTVKIYNLSGQEVFNIVVNDLNATVNMNNLNAGVYIAQISVDGTSQSVKFIKE